MQSRWNMPRRELEGAIMKLINFSRSHNKPIHLALAMEALADLIPSTRKNISFPNIEAVIVEHYALKSGDLQSPRRTKSIAFPRQISMFLARELTDLSLEEVGKALGGRDHTTVLYAVNKIKNLLESDLNLRNTIDTLQLTITKS